MDSNSKFNLITRDLEEITNERILINVLKERNLKIYWGVVPFDVIDLGLLIPILKIADFLKAESEVLILFADIHSFLESTKHFEKYRYKIKYYIKIIKLILSKLNVNIDKLTFITGSEFQFLKTYTFDVYKLMSTIPVNEINKANKGVISKGTYPKASSILYPVLQLLDEEYLKIDAQLGGIEQKGIFSLSDKYLPTLGYKRKVHLMTTSKVKWQIDILASKDTIIYFIDRLPIQQIIKIIKYIVFPIAALSGNKPKFKDSDGDLINYSYFESFQKAMNESELSNEDINSCVSEYISSFLNNIKSSFLKKESNIKLLGMAFPQKN